MGENLGRSTILVVDDDALIAMNTVDLLDELGYDALEAYSGAEALRILDERPDITAVMTDMSMPGMTGLELAEAISDRQPALPVVLVTGYAELPQNLTSTLPRLEKPYTLEELDKMLTELLA